MYCMYYHPEEGNNNSLTLTLTAHARLKRGRISHEIQESIARAGWRFLRGKRYHANVRYAENRSIPFSRRFARVENKVLEQK